MTLNPLTLGEGGALRVSVIGAVCHCRGTSREGFFPSKKDIRARLWNEGVVFASKARELRRESDRAQTGTRRQTCLNWPNC